MKFSLSGLKNSQRSRRHKKNKNASKKGKANKYQPKQATARVRAFHAVSIASRANKCAAADLLGETPYLSSQAPSLPLFDCEHPQNCACKYQHHDDRRGEMRRDIDFGLPGRRYDMEDRRQGLDTRRLPLEQDTVSVR